MLTSSLLQKAPIYSETHGMPRGTRVSRTTLPQWVCLCGTLTQKNHISHKKNEICFPSLDHILAQRNRPNRTGFPRCLWLCRSNWWSKHNSCAGGARLLCENDGISKAPTEKKFRQFVIFHTKVSYSLDDLSPQRNTILLIFKEWWQLFMNFKTGFMSFWNIELESLGQLSKMTTFWLKTSFKKFRPNSMLIQILFFTGDILKYLLCKYSCNFQSKCTTLFVTFEWLFSWFCHYNAMLPSRYATASSCY